MPGTGRGKAADRPAGCDGTGKGPGETDLAGALRQRRCGGRLLGERHNGAPAPARAGRYSPKALIAARGTHATPASPSLTASPHCLVPAGRHLPAAGAPGGEVRLPRRLSGTGPRGGPLSVRCVFCPAGMGAPGASAASHAPGEVRCGHESERVPDRMPDAWAYGGKTTGPVSRVLLCGATSRAPDRGRTRPDCGC